MKFRCKIIQATQIQKFTLAIQSMAKFSKHCVVRISSTGLFLIAFEDSGERQPVVWCNINSSQYFAEYDLCGVSEEHNEICLRLMPNSLLKILHSYKPSQLLSKHLKISLTRRKTPCITLEFFRTEPELTRLCLHDVSIELIPRKDWHDIAPPEIALSPDLTICFPDLDNLESVWDKLKSLSRHIVVLANGRGTLSLKIETELSDVTSHFKDLPVTVGEDYPNSDDFVKGRVKCSKFMLLKDLIQNNPAKILLHVRNRKYLLFDVFYDELTLHYIIPAIRK